MTSSTTFLIAFVFFKNLHLGLDLRLTYINKKAIVAELSLIISIVPTTFVFFDRFVVFWVSGIDFFILEGNWRLVFISILTAFSTTSSYKFGLYY